MNLYIYQLKGTIYEGLASSVGIPTTEGQITVLPKHINLVSSLSPGAIRYVVDEKENFIEVKSGVVHVGNNKVTILAN